MSDYETVMREAFEADVKESLIGRTGSVERHGIGYMDEAVDDHWQTWQTAYEAAWNRRAPLPAEQPSNLPEHLKLEVPYEALEEMYASQCRLTDMWAEKAEAKSDAVLLARIAELERDLATMNQRYASVANGSLLRAPISASNPLPPGCYCQPGQCQAPRIMGRQTPCRDPKKASLPRIVGQQTKGGGKC